MKKLLCSVLVLMLTITALPVWANDEILDDALFYAEPTFCTESGDEIDTVTAGKIACRYVITNRADAETSVTVLMGMYDENVLKDLDAVTHSVGKEETAVWETTVTATDANSVIRLFVAESGHPVRLAAVLNNKSRNCAVKSFSLGDYEGEVNNDSGRIDLRVPNTLDLTEATPTAVLADGAEATYDGSDFSDTVTMTVTAENGAEKTYRIYTTTYPATFKLDFENDTVGEKPTGWTVQANAGCTMTVEVDPENETNHVMKLNDTSTRDQVKAAYAFAEMPVPFKVSYKVRYGHGTDTYNADGSAVQYYWTSVDHRDAGETITEGHDNGALSNISAWETGQDNRTVWQYEYKSASTGNKIQYPSQKQLSSVNKNYNLHLDTWYRVEIAYSKDGYMTYSVDGTQLTKVLMINAEKTANQFYATTRGANTGYMYLDDITFTPLEVEQPTSIDMNFDEMGTGALTELEGFTISAGGNADIVSQTEGNALQLSEDTMLTAALSDLAGEAELSFDLKLPTTGNSLEAKLGDGAAVTFVSDENEKLKICYTTTSGGDKTVTTKAEADEANAVKVLNCYSEKAEKRMIMIFVEDELIAVYAPSATTETLSEMSLAGAEGSTAVIDNLKLH